MEHIPRPARKQPHSYLLTSTVNDSMLHAVMSGSSGFELSRSRCSKPVVCPYSWVHTMWRRLGGAVLATITVLGRPSGRQAHPQNPVGRFSFLQKVIV